MGTVSRLEKTPGDNYTHLNITAYCIMAIISKALHQIKVYQTQLRYSPCYNIEHWLQAFLPRKLLSISSHVLPT